MSDPETFAAEQIAEARWHTLINSAVDGIIVIDAHGRIETFNAAAERMFGYTEAEVYGHGISMLMPEPDRSRHDAYLANHLETGERKVIGIGRAVVAMRKNGTTFPIHLSVGEMVIEGQKHFTGILHDLSERTELEERLREASALARLGEMAAVIAHEVKNPLAAVRGAIQVIGGRLPSASSDASIVKEIIGRLDALNDLIQDLLVFARPPKPRLLPTNLDALLRATADLLRRDPSLSALRIQVEGETPPLPADQNLLTIVFQNLFINATHAMHGKGVIRVTTVAVDEWHTVEVRDEGPGIPREIRATLFRPFQTTKARGTGLGLATARRLVELHGGRISVNCPEAGGTIVRVDLPSTRD
jgi:two-component system sensor kinase FixL